MRKKMSLKYLIDRNNTRIFLAIVKAEKEIQKILGEKDE